MGLPIKIIPAPPSGLIPRSRGSRGVALCVYNYMPPLPHLGISNFFTRFLEMIANIFNCKRFLNFFFLSTGKSLSEAHLFAEHGENMLCTEIVFGIQNNFCTQHVLPMFCKNKSFWQRFTCTSTFVPLLQVSIYIKDFSERTL